MVAALPPSTWPPARPVAPDIRRNGQVKSHTICVALFLSKTLGRFTSSVEGKKVPYANEIILSDPILLATVIVVVS